jgi:hypothetical protein
MAPPPVARAKLDAFGLDNVCEAIAAGESMSALARRLHVGYGQLSVWIASDPERSARVQEARASTAKLWDEEAERLLKKAPDPFELTRARELGHHYRWRASKIAPKEYGDKSTVDANVSVTLRDLVRSAAAARAKSESS